MLNKAYEFHAADDARKAGVYPYFRPFDFNDVPEAVIYGKRVTISDISRLHSCLPLVAHRPVSPLRWPHST